MSEFSLQNIRCEINFLNKNLNAISYHNNIKKLYSYKHPRIITISRTYFKTNLLQSSYEKYQALFNLF